MINYIGKGILYLMLGIIVYVGAAYFVKNIIEVHFIDGSYGPLLPIYSISELVIKSNWGNDKIVTPFIGVFETQIDKTGSIYYRNIVAGRGDTYQVLIYDNPQKTGIENICDNESGELLYCSCVSESSRWCMVHIHF